MRTTSIAAALAFVLAGTGLAQAQQAKQPAASAAAADKVLMDSFSVAPEWKQRLEQDETQKLCTLHGNAPPRAIGEAILAREKAAIAYPTDGQLMGDWKKGEALAQSGYGGRFTDYPPRNANGGNCYACHQLDKKELSFGTLGPSLLEYGKIRKFSADEVKAVYERIYNPHAAIPCANMPRMGTNKFLTIDQIKDLVAYVMSPESPVNK